MGSLNERAKEKPCEEIVIGHQMPHQLLEATDVPVSPFGAIKELKSLWLELRRE